MLVNQLDQKFVVVVVVVVIPFLTRIVCIFVCLV